MKNEICSFSGQKIYPGHGNRFVRGDSKVFIFAKRKCDSYFHQRLNPRALDWTVLYRRKHKKDLIDQASRRTRRRVKKVERAFVGAPLELLADKRRTDVQDRIREKAISQIKEKKKVKELSRADKKARKAELKSMHGQQKAFKAVPRGAGRS